MITGCPLVTSSKAGSQEDKTRGGLGQTAGVSGVASARPQEKMDLGGTDE